jgi:large subunit ribosomal protein L6
MVDERRAEVKGPKGTLEVPVAEPIRIEDQDGVLVVSREGEEGPIKALHGMTRALLANAVHGVTEGYERVLEVKGTGYRAEAQGQKLVLSVGYSHPIEMEMPEGISVRVEDRNTTIILSGIDKQQIGQVAANIRSTRPPDAYKGKGVRYRGEQISLKPGKAAAK